MSRKPKRFADPGFPMTAAEFRFALGVLGLNQSAFARWIRIESRTVRSWIAEQYPVPMVVSRLLTLMIKTNSKPEDLS